MTEMVEARDVRVGDVIVLDADTTATVSDRDENARWSTVWLAVVRDKGARTTLWLPSNALLSVKRKPRKWRQTITCETDDAEVADRWRATVGKSGSGPATTYTYGPVEEVEQ